MKERTKGHKKRSQREGRWKEGRKDRRKEGEKGKGKREKGKSKCKISTRKNDFVCLFFVF